MYRNFVLAVSVTAFVVAIATAESPTFTPSLSVGVLAACVVGVCAGILVGRRGRGA